MKIALRRRIVFLSFLGLSFLMLGTVTNAYSADLSFGLKLGGGIGYLFNGAGDLEKARLGYQSYAADWVETNYTSTFNWKKLSILPDFRFEAILKIGESFGIGLGSAYLSFTSEGKYSLDHAHSYAMWYGTQTHYYTDDYTRTYKLTAIPLTLNLYFFLPMGGMNFYGYAGPGVYFGSFKHDLTDAYHENYTNDAWWGEQFQQDWTLDFTTNETATQTAFGFQGGLGLEIPISPNISFGIEASGRYVNFNNWEGDWTESVSGVYREYDNWLGGWYYTSSGSASDSGHGFWYDFDKQGFTGSFYNEMWLSTTAPSGMGLQNVQKAAINLNSIGILANIIFHF